MWLCFLWLSACQWLAESNPTWARDMRHSAFALLLLFLSGIRAVFLKHRIEVWAWVGVMKPNKLSYNIEPLMSKCMVCSTALIMGTIKNPGIYRVRSGEVHGSQNPQEWTFQNILSMHTRQGFIEVCPKSLTAG